MRSVFANGVFRNGAHQISGSQRRDAGIDGLKLGTDSEVEASSFSKFPKLEM